MTLHPSTAPQRVRLPSPPASSLPDGLDPESDSLRPASPTVTHFLTTAVTGPSFESTVASTLIGELVDCAAACRLDYATSLVAESASASVCPPSVGGECALGTDVLEERQEEFECFAAAVPHLVSMLLAHEGDPDAPDIPTPRSYAEAIEGIYIDEVPPPGANIAPREWHDTLRTTLAALGFAPSTADPSLFLRTDTTLPPFYVLVYVDDLVFATADTEPLAHVKSELQKRHTCTDLAPPSDEFVEPSGPYPELVGCLMYLMTCTGPNLAYPLSLLACYVALGRHRKVHWDVAKRVLHYLCSTSGMGLVLGGRARVVLTGHGDASWSDDLTTHRSSQGYTFSLGSGSVSWQSTRSSSILSSSCEVEIYAGAMVAQELRWLTYLLTDLGEAPRSPPVLYINNKAMIALCQEHSLEHKTKHIALRYFLARELQQRGQLRLAYVASWANTTSVMFTVLLLLYITLHVNWPCGHLHVLRMRGDVVIHPELALPFLTGLVTSCSPPLCLWGFPTCTHLLASSVFPSFTILTPYRGLREGAPHRYAGGDGERLEDATKPPAELILKWIAESWADVPEKMVRKAFLTCGISNKEDGSHDHLILGHMWDFGEVEVLEDVMEEEQDEMVPNPFYPAPVVTLPDVTIEMEVEAVLAAEAEEVDEEAVPAKSDSSESDDGIAREADEWSDEGDEWWVPGCYEGAEVKECVAGDEDE
ncbi:unnamed protein product [Closterium sp. NIES-54]